MSHTAMSAVLTSLLTLSLSPLTMHAAEPGPWKRHTIDRSSRGADGVRLADVNGDGLPDIATGWEEGGRVKVYVNPGAKKAKTAWPQVTVGEVRSPEDAVLADLDGDGAVDVVSCCEGSTQTVFVHWAPKEPADYLNSQRWTTQPLPDSTKRARWMFALPLQVDGKNGIDVIAGAKGGGAEVGWFEAPENPRNLAAWKWHGIDKATWIMSLFARDIDGDGDADIILSDRKGKHRGCYWLENPGPGKRQQTPWKKHPIGGLKREVMFMKPCDLNGDKRLDFLVAVKGSDLLYFQRTADDRPAWKEHSIRMPDNTGTGKAVAAGDIDGDGRQNIVVTCEGARNKSGCFWLSPPKGQPLTNTNWEQHDISGTKPGVKYDRIELLDLDGDGDLDLLTCEERDNLGVFWYENPNE